MKCAKVAKSQKLLYLAGVSSFVFFFTLALSWRHLSEVIKNAQLEFHSTSTLFKIWSKNDIPNYLEIYLYNLTNAKEYESDKTTVPDFREVGPFVFRERREKLNVSWNDSEETISFNQSRTWQFLPGISENLSVNVTNINPIAATIAYMSRLWESPLQREIANALLKAREPLVVTASALQWIFDGIPDEFLEMFDHLRALTEISIPYSKFGWFYLRNGSTDFDGVFTLKTGKSDLNNLGMMVAWNLRNQTEHYEAECGLVRGSTGEINPPLKHFRDSYTVFASDICSYITLKRVNQVLFKGIEAFEYVGDETVFDNGTFVPENSCFYLGESCPSGCRNVSSCRFGSPAFISFPHFYLADSFYTRKITGMKPNENKHKFILAIEPETGVPLKVQAAFQINFYLDSYPWCDEFRNISKIYIPMLWFRQTVQIPDEYSTVLKIVLFLQKHGGYILFSYAFFVLFLILVAVYWNSGRALTSKK